MYLELILRLVEKEDQATHGGNLSYKMSPPQNLSEIYVSVFKL